LRRSSNGKSNSVASIIVVSSTDTLCTQSIVSLRGSASSTAPVRSRITSVMRCRFIGATTGDTTLRCSSWYGGSDEMKLRRRNSAGRSVMVMPPCFASDEYA
jgi:hypothetical protein